MPKFTPLSDTERKAKIGTPEALNAITKVLEWRREVDEDEETLVAQLPKPLKKIKRKIDYDIFAMHAARHKADIDDDNQDVLAQKRKTVVLRILWASIRARGLVYDQPLAPKNKDSRLEDTLDRLIAGCHGFMSTNGTAPIQLETI